MTRVFGYMRCSGQGQVDGDTWDRQRQAIGQYLLANDCALADIFKDEGISGKTELEGRAGLSMCMARCQSEGITTVVVESADRLARDLIVSELIIREFQRIGVSVISAAGGIDLTKGDAIDPTSKLVRQILSAFAEFEKSGIVNKLRAARMRVRERDGRCEGRKPYGSLPGESDTLELLNRGRLLKMTPRAIAELLNEEGKPSRSGKPWSTSSVYKIVKREKASAQHSQTARP